MELPLVSGLKLIYFSLWSEETVAVQELIPPKAISAAKDSLLPPSSGSHTTPISPNFPQPALTSSVPSESLAKWQETATLMAFSQTTGDSAALTALGDYLAANRWFEAAHAWFAISDSISLCALIGLIATFYPPARLRSEGPAYRLFVLFL